MRITFYDPADLVDPKRLKEANITCFLIAEVRLTRDLVFVKLLFACCERHLLWM